MFRVILFLDYDGTLVHIAKSPEEAKIKPENKTFLEKVAKTCTLSIITGRDIKSFREVFGTISEDIFVITSHGHEIYRGERLLWKHGDCNPPPLEPLKDKLKSFEGSLLEIKKMGFAVHYRNVADSEVGDLLREVEEFLEKNTPVKIIRGKKVIEAIYCKVDKGTGVRKLLELIGWRGEGLAYFGDDTTDLDGMRAVKELGGKTFFVGDAKPPVADDLLSNPEEVYEVLKSLCTTKR